MKTFSTPVFSRLATLATVIQHDTPAQAGALLDRLISDPVFAGKAWQRDLKKLRAVISGHGPQFTIIKLDGNSKLPFCTFSTLPGVTCPGAGACLNFCYSFKAWRYPGAFCRQAQNAFLMRYHPDAITQAFNALPVGIDFRLYVDGDFASSSDVAFWFGLLQSRPDVKAYGYSKSFDAILDHQRPYPANYQLNLSGGHNATLATVNWMKALPITRGEFIAVPIGRKVKSTDHGKPETNKAIRAVAGKVFPCPGKCGSCTGQGHACGMPKLKGVTIAIAMH